MLQILNYLNLNPVFKQYLAGLKHQKSQLINELTDEAMILLIIEAFYSTDKTIFVATPNLYKAQLLYDKLTSIIPDEYIAFFT